MLVDTPSTAPGRGYALDPHDCVVSKLVAGREKDYEFAAAPIDAGLIDPDVLKMRAEAADVAPLVRRRLAEWIASRR